MHNKIGFPLVIQFYENHFYDDNANRKLRDKASIVYSETPETKSVPDVQGFRISLADAAKDTLLHFNKLNELGDANVDMIHDTPEPLRGLPGWQRILADGTVEQAELTSHGIYIIDTETVNMSSYFKPMPVLAQVYDLVCNEYYLWIHPWFFNTSQPYVEQLVPVPSHCSLLAWNTAFDRSKITYDSTHEWYDLMSLHIVLHGICSQQTYWYATKVKTYYPAWASAGSPANLDACYRFYTGLDVKLEKDLREHFVKAKHPSDLLPHWNDLIRYSLADVTATARVFKVLWCHLQNEVRELEAFLHAHVSTNSMVPYVSDEWETWLESTDKLWSEIQSEIESELAQILEQTYEAVKQGELDTELDPWLSQLNWTPLKSGKNKGLPKCIADLRKKLTLKSTAAALLLRVTYLGKPVWYDKKIKWCIKDDDGELHRVLHHTGDEEANCGGLFSQNYDNQWSEGTMKSDYEQAQDLLRKSRSIAFWTSARSRCHEVRFVK